MNYKLIEIDRYDIGKSTEYIVDQVFASKLAAALESDILDVCGGNYKGFDTEESSYLLIPTTEEPDGVSIEWMKDFLSEIE